MRPVSLRYSSIAIRVWSVNSNRTGRPVFLCRIVARSIAYPLGATSSTRTATTSQPRSLLSIRDAVSKQPLQQGGHRRIARSAVERTPNRHGEPATWPQDPPHLPQCGDPVLKNIKPNWLTTPSIAPSASADMSSRSEAGLPVMTAVSASNCASVNHIQKRPCTGQALPRRPMPPRWVLLNPRHELGLCLSPQLNPRPPELRGQACP